MGVIICGACERCNTTRTLDPKTFLCDRCAELPARKQSALNIGCAAIGLACGFAPAVVYWSLTFTSKELFVASVTVAATFAGFVLGIFVGRSSRGR